eukprot:CAMPEP_0114330222 /NCGR_PEP_ID=MMETSP0101-20121206/1613_1 /TAXON_ID=38822 ORGANISM="Pteridomonas danica, Strain PT" /NCGR_SAMPLE_ID=MMETSP0101 /ASSEMBLY_ACC=CAM_ASM_000211 /LENGTH=149 /DNA_ID=CAMNT_0001460173 /DNA_START=832 /DNA_END=1281 /DNA_ORIENTATION=+
MIVELSSDSSDNTFYHEEHAAPNIPKNKNSIKKKKKYSKETEKAELGLGFTSSSTKTFPKTRPSEVYSSNLLKENVNKNEITHLKEANKLSLFLYDQALTLATLDAEFFSQVAAQQQQEVQVQSEHVVVDGVRDRCGSFCGHTCQLLFD